jgi:hypothetical protein
MTSDYMNTTGVISTHDVFEGMALFRLQNGTYYVVTSHLTGVCVAFSTTQSRFFSYVHCISPISVHTSLNFC